MCEAVQRKYEGQGRGRPRDPPGGTFDWRLKPSGPLHSNVGRRVSGVTRGKYSPRQIYSGVKLTCSDFTPITMERLTH